MRGRRVPLFLVAAAAALSCAAAGGEVGVTVRPDDVVVDEPVAIAVGGLRARERLTLRVSTVAADGRRWVGTAVFRASSAGRVDVRTATSIAGTYRGRDPMGLFWSMSDRPDGPGRYIAPDEATIAVEAVARGRVLGRARLVRRSHRAGLDRRELTLEADGLVGRFSAPRGIASAPAVLLLGGSEGGIPDGLDATILASRGYPTLQLAYFGVAGLPDQLREIPLEYFAAALRWLAVRPEVDRRRIAIFGVSRGAEAALLVGATYPGLVGAVIAYVPSSVVNVSTDRVSPAWTLEGRPVPYAPASDFGNPHPANTAAIIPVERIEGPVLLVSGAQDSVWPSGLYAGAIVARRAAGGKPTTSLAFLGAGHAVGVAVPHVPARALGGTRAADAAARAKAWPQVLRLLRSLGTASSL